MMRLFRPASLLIAATAIAACQAFPAIPDTENGYLPIQIEVASGGARRLMATRDDVSYIRLHLELIQKATPQTPDTWVDVGPTTVANVDYTLGELANKTIGLGNLRSFSRYRLTATPRNDEGTSQDKSDDTDVPLKPATTDHTAQIEVTNNNTPIPVASLTIQLADEAFAGGSGHATVAVQSGSIHPVRSNVIVTVAGGDRDGNHDDEGTEGLDNDLRGISGVAIAPNGSKYAGQIFVALADQGVIRRIDPFTRRSYAVTRNEGSDFVPGNADMARFKKPMGLAFNGNKLYVSDVGASVIGLIDFDKEAEDSTYVTLFAGTQMGGVSQPGFVDGVVGDNTYAGRLNEPQGIAFDKDAHTLVVADSRNNAIRSINLATGYMSTLAGPDATGGSTPGASGDVPEVDGSPVTNQSARFETPTDIAVHIKTGPSDQDRYWVTDSLNDCIRVLRADNTVANYDFRTEIPHRYISQPAGITMTQDGPPDNGRHLYVAGCRGGRNLYLRQIDLPTSNVLDLLVGPSEIGMMDGRVDDATSPYTADVLSSRHIGLAFDAFDRLYFAEYDGEGSQDAFLRQFR